MLNNFKRIFSRFYGQRKWKLNLLLLLIEQEFEAKCYNFCRWRWAPYWTKTEIAFIVFFFFGNKLCVANLLSTFCNLYQIKQSGVWIFVLPEKDTTWMLCLLIALSCPGFTFTTMRSLPFILSGPYSDKTALHCLRLPHSYAYMPKELNSCSVFRSSQCKAHKLTSQSSSSRRKRRSSLMPVHLKYWKHKS